MDASDTSLFERLRDVARNSSASIGVTDLAPFPDERLAIESRVQEGMHGSLAFTYANSETASSPETSFPWANSIVVVAVPYLRDGDGESDNRSVARFADGDRYRPLREVLAALSEVLEVAGHRNEIVYDDNRLLDRAIAIRAGVAWRGKSTMGLTPGFGPWVLIGSVVTAARLEVTPPMKRGCGTCDACMPACPTGAIVAPGVLDARLCIAAILQTRGTIEPTMRLAIGGRIYGCDDCLTSCPPGQPLLRSLQPTEETLAPADVLQMSDRDLAPIVEHWYVPSRSMRFVRRNALVALGNTGDETSLALLAGYVGHSDPLLAGHAAWAVGRIGGASARSICETALAHENRASVLEEVRAAVAAC